MKITIEQAATSHEVHIHSAAVHGGTLSYQLGEGGEIQKCKITPELEAALVDAVQAHQHELAAKKEPR